MSENILNCTDCIMKYTMVKTALVYFLNFCKNGKLSYYLQRVKV